MNISNTTFSKNQTLVWFRLFSLHFRIDWRAKIIFPSVWKTMQQLVQRFHGYYTFYYGRPREYFHPVVSFYLLSFFFPRLISAATHCMSTILPHMVCANLQCMFDMCCTWLAETTGSKKSPKIRHLGTIAQIRRAISSQVRHVSTIGNKPVKIVEICWGAPN